MTKQTTQREECKTVINQICYLRDYLKIQADRGRPGETRECHKAAKVMIRGDEELSSNSLKVSSIKRGLDIDHFLHSQLELYEC